jgi:hypothetical protein
MLQVAATITVYIRAQLDKVDSGFKVSGFPCSLLFLFFSLSRFHPHFHLSVLFLFFTFLLNLR